MKTRRGFIALAISLSGWCCNPLRGWPEATFRLTPESRLPRWFSIPAGTSSRELTVTVSYYVPMAPIDDAIVELRDKSGHILSRVSGQMCWHPSNSAFVYVTIQGAMEVLEHHDSTFTV